MGSHKRFPVDEDDGSVKRETPLKVDHPEGKSGFPISKKANFTQKGVKRKNSSKSVKGNMRSIQRLLKNKGSEMAPAARKAKEAQLEELTRLKDEHDRREKERAIAKKYRMIKFFEKRKLQRTLDMIVQKGNKEEDAEQKKQIMVDLRYINEYPKDKKYLSLFPNGGHTEESRKRLEDMREQIVSKSTLVEAEKGASIENNETKQGHEEDDFFLTAT